VAELQSADYSVVIDINIRDGRLRYAVLIARPLKKGQRVLSAAGKTTTGRIDGLRCGTNAWTGCCLGHPLADLSNLGRTGIQRMRPKPIAQRIERICAGKVASTPLSITRKVSVRILRRDNSLSV
jgi:hypothetical protein